MGGGIIQLIATGQQDRYLIGNPQITCFKTVFKRHSNFAMETFTLLPRGESSWNNKLIFDIERKADLLGQCYLVFYLTFHSCNGILTHEQVRKELSLEKFSTSLAKSLGHAMIEYIDVEIGGTRIDRHTGEYLAVRTHFLHDFSTRFRHYLLSETVSKAPHVGENVLSITVPLQFWFNLDSGSFLPLVSIQHHDVKILVKLNPKSKIVLPANLQTRSANHTTLQHLPVCDISIIDVHLNCNYIYLDQAEQSKFAHKRQDYLIQQVQILPILEDVSSASSEKHFTLPLNLNHPVTQIMWTIHDYDDAGVLGPIWSSQRDRVKSALIQVNGVDRFTAIDGHYFQAMQPFHHNKNVDFNHFCSELKYLLCNSFLDYNSTDFSQFPTSAVHPFVYNFSLDTTTQHKQPTGACNFSRIDNAVLKCHLNTNKSLDPNDTTMFAPNGYYVQAYAVNYNVLKIQNGVAMLAYAN